MEGSAKFKLEQKFPGKEVLQGATLVAIKDADTIKEIGVQRVYAKPDGTTILRQALGHHFDGARHTQPERVIILHSDGTGYIWEIGDSLKESPIGIRSDLNQDEYDLYSGKARRLVEQYGSSNVEPNDQEDETNE